MDKFVNKCADIITTRSFLILCDYLENVNGVKPHLKSSQRSPGLQLDVSFEDGVGDDSDASDIDFEGEILRDLGQPVEKVKQFENEVFDSASHIEVDDQISNFNVIHVEESSKLGNHFPDFNMDLPEVDIVIAEEQAVISSLPAPSLALCETVTNNQILLLPYDSQEYASVESDKADRKEKHILTPKKHRLRDKMRNTLEKQRERMKKNHKCKNKSISFEMGAVVSVSIPKEDRAKFDATRIKGTIVEIKTFKRGFRMYRVATEFGTLDGWIRVSQLRIYFGKVNLTSAVDNHISLREAAQLYAAAKENSCSKCCKCTNGCVDRRCGCVKHGHETQWVTKCSARCHNGSPCSNQFSQTNLPIFPAYGGVRILSNSDKIYFSNTCAVDCWLALIKVMQTDHAEILEAVVSANIIGPNSEMMVFIGYVRHGFYEKAKNILAVRCNIPLCHNTYDFFGNEVENVLCHLSFLVECSLTSTCTNGHRCPESIASCAVRDFPCVSGNTEDDFVMFIVH